jgi:orotate phosphoribosyltransferase-like protein
VRLGRKATPQEIARAVRRVTALSSQGMTDREIAQATGISKSQVQRLRDQAKQREAGPAAGTAGNARRTVPQANCLTCSGAGSAL